MSEIMPGAWVCDKCGFVLQNSTLHVADGSVSANTADECKGCPNDGGPMRALTWREAELRAENEELKREKENQWNAVKVVTDEIFRAIGDAEHVNENINVGVRRVVAERDSLRAQLESAFKGVLCIRCARHLAVPQINANEYSGGECGACIAEGLSNRA
jgi:hypothetical protein